tara:strand:- start:295442 stop:296884 length:1443 start_codon:yes stop_codon:yes gene_type:complete
MKKPVIYWFRQDLRTYDLPGLAAALGSGRPVLACYIHDESAAGDWAPGGASRWWLHHSLESLGREIADLGGSLCLRSGDTADVMEQLIAATDADTVLCSRQYEPWAVELENRLHESLDSAGVTLKRYPGTLLFEPGSVKTQADQPYKVFTPFWRACRALPQPPQPRGLPDECQWLQEAPPSDALEDWALTPQQPDWAAGWENLWQPGSDGARRRLQEFLSEKAGNYSEGRDHPACDSTSRLSPHLHFGEISPREIWHTAQAHGAGSGANAREVDKFLSELGWREFSYQLLVHFPDIPHAPFKQQFSHFPWSVKQQGLRAWQQGQTGYPVVDAGMRELWQTGYMHNRVRMVVASFLTKHLLIHWRAGEDWFWDTLLDADLANNACSWQWVAGSGADAAPYFRIFNPVAQGEKFDRDGDYVRRWVPELAALPDKYLHHPWDAPADVLESAGVVLGQTYPEPVVDHRAAREATLSAYAQIKGE